VSELLAGAARIVGTRRRTGCLTVVAMVMLTTCTQASLGTAKERPSSSRAGAVRLRAAHQRIAFSSNMHGRWNIWSAYPDGSHLRRLTSTNLSAWEENTQPAYSPDGSKIAFVNQSTGHLNIYVMNSDGTDVQDISNYNGDDQLPSWSPDGTKIAFTREGDHTNIFTMGADGSDQTDVTNYSGNIGDGTASWGPSGEIVFSSYRHGSWGIYRIMPDGTRLRAIHSSAGHEERFPAWSPERSRILFVRNVTGSSNFELYSMRLSGRRIRRLTHDPATDEMPCWSPNGKRIAWVRGTRHTLIQIGRYPGRRSHTLFDRRAFFEFPTWST
jgi:Tol biopolymer transport system component